MCTARVGLQVEQVTFSGKVARERGQEIMFITDRAVFSLEDEGILLNEIADGVDLQRDVLDQIEFEVHISPQLQKMDPRLFHDSPMGLRDDFLKHGNRS